MFVSVGNSRMDKKFNGQEMSYEDFAKRLSQTTYTAETMEQYRKMPKGHGLSTPAAFSGSPSHHDGQTDMISFTSSTLETP